jgi:orotate phosphoribosyltransferase-like protein
MKENDFNYKELEQLANNGLSNKEIAQSLNISDKTYYYYLKKFTHFTYSIKKGREKF